MSAPTEGGGFARLEREFLILRDLDESQREERLSDLAAQDEDLVSELRRLLDADGGTAFVDDRVAQNAALGRPDLGVGDRVGDFELVEIIGEGGMGRVWLARQQRPRREVALKLMRSGLVSREARRRFELEAEILGALHHPGIAEIHAAGVQDIAGTAVPWFAMEFVRGSALGQHVGIAGLDNRQRIELFIRLCEALAHAHDKGIIHRDLKPANIFVTPEGQPKVLDFGVARATDSDLASTTMLTNDGQIVGTVAYMSPEQTEGRPESIGPGTDIYSLGVILFELLTGRRPQEFSGFPALEAMRRIRDDDPLSLSSVDRRFSGDLDTIVGKCLEKIPVRRYTSAWLLADDLRRYLKGEPILARPPSTLDRSWKFLRRHRRGAAALAIIFLGLGLGAFGLWRGKNAAEDSARREQGAAIAARAALSRYERVLGFLDDSLAALDTATTGREVPTLEAFADEVARGLEQGLSEDRDSRIALLTTLGNAYSGIGREADATQVLERGLLDRREAGETGLVAEGLYHLARHWVRTRSFERARPLIDEALALPAVPRGPGRRSRILLLSGLLEFLDGQHNLALEIFSQAEAQLKVDPEASRSDHMILAQYHAKLDTIQWRIEDAIRGNRACITEAEALLGKDHPRIAEIQLDLAEALLAAGRVEEAKKASDEALARLVRRFGRHDVVLYRNLVIPGRIMLEQGKLDEAERYLSELIAVSEARGEPEDAIAHARGTLAGVLLRKDRHEEAHRLLATSIEAYRRIWPQGHFILANSLVNLSALTMARREPQLALKYAEDAWTMSQDFLGADVDTKAGHQLARVLRAFDRTDEAIEVQSMVVEREEARKGPAAEATLAERLLLGSFQFDAGRHEAAIKSLSALNHFDQGTPARLAHAVAISRRCLGGALAEMERFEEAETVLAQALEECRALGPRGEALVRDVARRLRDVREEL